MSPWKLFEIFGRVGNRTSVKTDDFSTKLLYDGRIVFVAFLHQLCLRVLIQLDLVLSLLAPS